MSERAEGGSGGARPHFRRRARDATLLQAPLLAAAIAVLHAAAAGAESVSPWAMDDPAEVAAASRLRVQAAAFAASDFAPAIHFAKAALDSRNPPKPGTNRALGIAEAGVYYDSDGFEVGAFRRMDAFGTADSAAIAAIQALNSKTALDAGRTYAGAYAYRVIDLQGIRLGKAFKLPLPDAGGWSGALGASVSALRGVRIKTDSFSGSLANSVANARTLDGQRSEADSNVSAADYNAYLVNGTPIGYGYTSDAGLRLQHASGVRLYLIADLASSLRWHDVPTRVYSVQGYTGLPGTPLPEGSATTAPFSNRLTRKTTVGASLDLQSYRIEGALTRLMGLKDASLGVQREFGAWSAGVAAYPHWHALGFALAHPDYGRLRIVADTLSITRAHALGLQFEKSFTY